MNIQSGISLVVALDDPAATLELVGGKGASLHAASEQITQLFAQQAMSDAIAEPILHSYAAPGGGDLPVAV